MRYLQISVLSAVLAVVAIAQTDNRSTITVQAVPPEPVPVGTCTSSTASYLVSGSGDKRSDFKLSDRQIGEYVRIRMAQGYSLALYPQTSGKIYVVATCPAKR